MRGIRINTIDGKNYYVYDLPQDVTGRRKRLYAVTKELLLERIKEEEENRKLKLKYSIPKTSLVSDVSNYYILNLLGNASYNKVKEFAKVRELLIVGRCIDIPIEELSNEAVNEYLRVLSNSYSQKVMHTLVELLDGTTVIAKSLGYTSTLDRELLIIPTCQSKSNYIPTSDELDRLLAFCFSKEGMRYQENSKLIGFSILTSIPISECISLKKADIDFDNDVIHTSFGDYSLEPCVKMWLDNNANQIDLVDNIYDWTRIDFTQLPINAYRYGEYPFVFAASGAEGVSQIRKTTVSNTLKAMMNRASLPSGITTKTLDKACFIRDYNIIKDANERQFFIINFSQRRKISMAALEDWVDAYLESQAIKSGRIS